MSIKSSLSLEKLMRVHPVIGGRRPSQALSTSVLISASSALATAAIVLVLILSRYASPGVLDRSDNLTIRSADHSSKHAFLSQLEREQQREVASQVHYLSDLIHRTRRSTQAPKALAFSIVRQSRRANYDPFFVTAVMKAESTFRQNARSHVGALGLMQIMPATGRYVSNKIEAQWVGPNRLLQDPEYNIQLGIEYLKYLEEMFHGDMEKVLIAYNWGPTNLRRALSERRNPPRSSVQYARTIIADTQKWQNEFYQKKDNYRYLNVNFLTEPLFASNNQGIRPG